MDGQNPWAELVDMFYDAETNAIKIADESGSDQVGPELGTSARLFQLGRIMEATRLWNRTSTKTIDRDPHSRETINEGSSAKVSMKRNHEEKEKVAATPPGQPRTRPHQHSSRVP